MNRFKKGFGASSLHIKDQLEQVRATSRIAEKFLKPTGVLRILESLHLHQSPIGNALEPICRHQQSIENTFKSMSQSFTGSMVLEQFKHTQGILDEIRKIGVMPGFSEFTRMQKTMDAFGLQVSAINSIASQLAVNSAARAMEDIEASFDSLTEAAITGRLFRELTSSQIDSAFFSSTHETVKRLETLLVDGQGANEETDEEVEQLFNELLEKLASALTEAVEKIEIRSIANFSLWLIPILLSLYLSAMTSKRIDKLDEEIWEQTAETSLRIEDKSRQSEERDKMIISRLNELQETLDQRLEEADKGTFYKVWRSVPLNVDQHFMGEAILWLYPGQEVELIERNGKWIRVVTYDAISEQTHVGWVFKKYLRRIK